MLSFGFEIMVSYTTLLPNKPSVAFFGCGRVTAIQAASLETACRSHNKTNKWDGFNNIQHRKDQILGNCSLLIIPDFIARNYLSSVNHNNGRDTSHFIVASISDVLHINLYDFDIRNIFNNIIEDWFQLLARDAPWGGHLNHCFHLFPLM